MINVNKPGKVRVVFDCASTYDSISLNSQLLQGPNLLNNLVGVLIRFRQEQLALAADIEAMFHQVRVHERDCDALRFLWWPNGDLDAQPSCYRMQVHLFGATSSQSCAAHALKRTADDHANLFKPEVLETIHRNFYVDDCLKSVPSEKEAVKFALDLRSLLEMGGFKLTQWLSNTCVPAPKYGRRPHFGAVGIAGLSIGRLKNCLPFLTSFTQCRMANLHIKCFDINAYQ